MDILSSPIVVVKYESVDVKIVKSVGVSDVVVGVAVSVCVRVGVWHMML